MEITTTLNNGVTLTIDLIDDYTIKGSFNPNASCDLEYYGYRETDYTVISATYLDVELTEEEYSVLVNYERGLVTLAIQNEIDALGEL